MSELIVPDGKGGYTTYDVRPGGRVVSTHTHSQPNAQDIAHYTKTIELTAAIKALFFDGEDAAVVMRRMFGDSEEQGDGDPEQAV